MSSGSLNISRGSLAEVDQILHEGILQSLPLFPLDVTMLSSSFVLLSVDRDVVEEGHVLLSLVN